MPEICVRCKASVRWAISASGDVKPIDAEPTSAGSLRLEGEDLPRAIPVPAGERATNELLYSWHAETCRYPPPTGLMPDRADDDRRYWGD
jgi:hypothetical protein